MGFALAVIFWLMLIGMLSGCSRGLMFQVGYMPVSSINHNQGFEAPDVIEAKRGVRQAKY